MMMSMRLIQSWLSFWVVMKVAARSTTNESR